MLQRYSPRAVYGDGNCFYRAMSLALYGTEKYHSYLRVRTALEIILNPDAYNNASASFVLSFLPILTPDYRLLVRDTLVLGSYSEMIHLYACSKALNISIQSYCSPVSDTSSHPYSVCINKPPSASTWKQGCVSVMWTVSSSTDTEPNHIVLLVPRALSTGLSPSSSVSREPEPNVEPAEMSDRDESALVVEADSERSQAQQVDPNDGARPGRKPVSYTHLTLPTILRV